MKNDNNNSQLIYERFYQYDIFLGISTQSSNHYGIMHTHSFFDFSFIVDGSVKQFYNDKEIIMVKNDFFIATPQCVHQIELNNCPYTLYNLEVRVPFINSLSSFFGGMSVFDILRSDLTILKLSDSEAQEISALMRLAQNNVSDINIYTAYLKLVVIKVLTSILLKNSNQQNTHPVVSTFLNEFNKKENFNLSIADICKNKNYSQEYINRLFKKANLDSPNHIFLKNKLTYASHLLISSDIKIIDITETCGIFTVSYFNKVFKKLFGIPPSAYRKKYSLLNTH